MQEGLMSIDTVNVADKAAAGDLYSLKIRELWVFFKSQDALFWLISLYLFFEYVRPQTLYPSLDVLPYTQIVIIVTLLLFFLQKKKRLVPNVENRLIILFFLVLILSSIFAMAPEISFSKLPEFVAWILIYFLIINIVNTENRFLLFILMFLIYNLKMAQFAFRGWASIGFGYGKDGTGGGPGWFQNSGEFGIEMCIFLPIATYFFIALKDRWPRWKRIFFLSLPFFAISGIISSSSRGAVIGGLAVVIVMLLKSKKKLIAIFITGCICFIAYQAVPEKQKERFDAAGQDNTSLSRKERWEKGFKMANEHPVLGVGYKNWAIADRRMFSGEGGLPHNVFVEGVSELGYSGLVIYLLMIIYSVVTNIKTRRCLRHKYNSFICNMTHGLDCALVGYIVSGFFVTVLYYPYFWVNMAFVVSINNIVINNQVRHEN